MGNYLIPANSKKSMLIFGLFNVLDLIIFGSGSVVTLCLLVILNTTNIYYILLECVPLFVALFLVMPLPYYHNVRILIKNTFTYLSGQKKYKWRGWCVKNVYGREEDGR